MKLLLSNIFVWAVALIFFFGGLDTYQGGARFVDEFTRWGYPLSALKYVGAFEMLSAILLIPRSTRYFFAAVLLLITILGLIKHVTSGDPFSLMVPGIVICLLIGGIYETKER